VGESIRINCSAGSKVCEPAELAALTSTGQHVVLQFTALTSEEQARLIVRLASALPDNSIFYSGGSQGSPWITVMPVVARSRVLERKAEVLNAVKLYRWTCVELIEQYEAKTLSAEWHSYHHGGHRLFKNQRTGQIVEAPLQGWTQFEQVDPYFFAMFVRSTAGFESITELFTHDYHDATRMLDIVANEAEPC
jgi:hypothetical protein